MIVDFDGRVLAQADPGPGEKIVIGPLDLAALRAARAERQMHAFLAHRRPQAYPLQQAAGFHGPITPGTLTSEDLARRIEDEKIRLGLGHRGSDS